MADDPRLSIDPPNGEGINGLLAHLGVGNLERPEGISTHLWVNLIYIIKMRRLIIANPNIIFDYPTLA